jgi:hypothetical protein
MVKATPMNSRSSAQRGFRYRLCLNKPTVIIVSITATSHNFSSPVTRRLRFHHRPQAER